MAPVDLSREAKLLSGYSGLHDGCPLHGHATVKDGTRHEQRCICKEIYEHDSVVQALRDQARQLEAEVGFLKAVIGPEAGP